MINKSNTETETKGKELVGKQRKGLTSSLQGEVWFMLSSSLCCGSLLLKQTVSFITSRNEGILSFKLTGDTW